MKKPQYKRNPSIIAKRIEKEFIVIDPVRETFYTMNATAECILQTLYRWREESHIVDKLLSVFDSERKEAKKDTEVFLKDLIRKHLVEVKR